jgi:hypothetical protein
MSCLRRFSSLVQASPHQQPALPPVNLWCREFNARPCEEARPFAPRTCTHLPPILPRQITRYLIHPPPGSLHLHLLLTRHRQHIRLLAGLQTGPQFLRTPVDSITCHSGDRETRIQSSFQHTLRQFRFGSKDHRSWHMGCSAAFRIVSSTLG